MCCGSSLISEECVPLTFLRSRNSRTSQSTRPTQKGFSVVLPSSGPRASRNCASVPVGLCQGRTVSLSPTELTGQYRLWLWGYFSARLYGNRTGKSVNGLRFVNKSVES